MQPDVRDALFMLVEEWRAVATDPALLHAGMRAVYRNCADDLATTIRAYPEEAQGPGTRRTAAP